MPTTNIYLLQFKIQNHLEKTWNLNASTSELISKKHHLEFLTFHSPFCLFLIKTKYFNTFRIIRMFPLYFYPQYSTCWYQNNKNPYFSLYNSKISALISLCFGSYSSKKYTYFWNTNFNFPLYFYNKPIPSVIYLFLP